MREKKLSKNLAKRMGKLEDSVVTLTDELNRCGVVRGRHLLQFNRKVAGSRRQRTQQKLVIVIKKKGGKAQRHGMDVKRWSHIAFSPLGETKKLAMVYGVSDTAARKNRQAMGATITELQ